MVLGTIMCFYYRLLIIFNQNLNVKMKIRSLILLTLTTMFFFVSCKKETAPTLTIATTTVDGTANANGEYTITGHISSSARLAKVILTKEGQTTPFLTDDSTAKNKNEYDYSYLVIGITTNTYVIIDIYDQAGGKITKRFLIKK